jgi:hypothetical protein
MLRFQTREILRADPARRKRDFLPTPGSDDEQVGGYATKVEEGASFEALSQLEGRQLGDR